MRQARRTLFAGPNHIIRWQGARLILDQVNRREGHDASAFAVNVNKGTRP